MPRLTSASFPFLPALAPDKEEELNLLINEIEISSYKCIFQSDPSWYDFWRHVDVGASLPSSMGALLSGVFYRDEYLPRLQEVVRRYLLAIVYRSVNVVMTQAGPISQVLQGGNLSVMYYEAHFRAIQLAQYWSRWLVENGVVAGGDCVPPCKLKPLL